LVVGVPAGNARGASHSGRGLFEQGLYLLLELFGEQYPLDGVSYVPVAVYDNRDRQCLSFRKEALGCFCAERDGVVDAEFSGEAPNRTSRFRRVRDADDLQTLLRVVAL
jgi:hypothetical protein